MTERTLAERLRSIRHFAEVADIAKEAAEAIESLTADLAQCRQENRRLRQALAGISNSQPDLDGIERILADYRADLRRKARAALSAPPAEDKQ